jgi:hypothetical protein
MIENNINKTEINLILFNFSEGTVDLNPLIDTTHKGLLYVGDKLGKQIVDTGETLLLRVKDLVDSKCSAIPEADRRPPNMRIAKGVLENVINLEETGTTLQEMFANLLAGSMDNRKSDDIHPSYAKLISELSEEEARFLKSLYERKEIPALRYHNDNIQYYKICKETVDYGDQSSVMISRIESKKLLDTESRGFANSYDNHVFTNYFQETEELLKTELGNTRLSTQRLCLRLTELGQHFMKAVTSEESPTDEKAQG